MKRVNVTRQEKQDYRERRTTARKETHNDNDSDAMDTRSNKNMKIMRDVRKSVCSGTVAAANCDSHHHIAYSKSGNCVPKGSSPAMPYAAAALSSGYFSKLEQ